MSGRKFRLPATLAQAADLIYTTRQSRLELQKRVDELREQEYQLKEHLIRELPKGEASGISGHVARVALTQKTRAQAEPPPLEGGESGWDKLHAHILRTGDWELLQRRLNDAAIRERWEAGQEVPGVEPYQFIDVSVTKL